MISPSLEDARRLIGDVPTPVSVWSRIRGSYTFLVRLWASLQVSYHGGKYSIERVLALNKYTRTKSLSRVLLVCIGTPLPMAAMVTLQELLPLQDPAEGWHANYGVWFRVAMLAGAVSHTYLIQGKYMAEGLAHSSSHLAMFVLVISGIYTAIGVLVGATLAFPIPFFYITMTPAFYVPLLLLLYSILPNNSKLTKFVCFIATQKIMGMIYPVYQLLFLKASTTHFVLPVILLLPMVKLLVKNVVRHFTSHLEDLTPETVIFTVDFYNALYLATCMESASSLNTMLVFIVTDFAQTITMLLGMHRRTSTVLHRLRQVANAEDGDDLLTALCLMCHNPATMKRQFREGVRIRSCLPHQLDPADSSLLCSLEALPVDLPVDSIKVQCWAPKRASSFTTPRVPSLLSAFQRVCSSNRLISIQPAPEAKPIAVAKRRNGRVAIGPDGIHVDVIQHSNILREALEVLYTTECLVLTAYLEAFIPLFYCGYMVFMMNLPNAKYHTELKGVTRQNVEYTARVVFLFGLLQVVAFLLLLALVKRNCGVRILYNLAFVLETQMALVQGKLMIWMLVTLACRVVHFG
jgi:hypothetical protein